MQLIFLKSSPTDLLFRNKLFAFTYNKWIILGFLKIKILQIHENYNYKLDKLNVILDQVKYQLEV
jgi:hypothetical protein